MLEQHSFGYWLRLQRKALDLTREGLAGRVGCSAATIRKIEAEERRPSEQIVELLAQVFNIPPNEQTAFLRFARGEWKSAPAETSGGLPWHVSAMLPRSNLPAPVTSLIGREQEIADVHEYLLREDIRLVTLIGPPGIGKTRLSIEAAHQSVADFSDGVFFIALAPLDDPSLIVSTIIQTIGFVEINDRSPIEWLKDCIRNKQILLVLDNCEHLIEEVAPLASELLAGCSRLKIIATSRESLRVPGEWLYPVPTLDNPKEASAIDMETASAFPALVLFAERAQAARSDFVLNADNLQPVVSICARLDGLPLAIELIAARIRLMSPQSLLSRLDDRFVLSADGMRAVSARQKTLNRAIGWSYDLLSAEEQKLFAWLSVFSGGFTLDAAEAIFSRTSTEKSVSDLVASLLDKSLLQHVLHEHGESRFNMLMTIQQFGLHHLRRISEETEVHNWHLAHFLDLAEQADSEIHGPNQVEWTDRLEKELDNFRAALDWSVSNQKAELALRLLGALSWIWFVRDRFSEIRGWFDRIRALPEINAHPALYARLLNHMGHQNWLSGDFRGARSVLAESREIWGKLGMEGERGLAEALDYLGMIARSSEGDHKTAQSFFERSFELYQKHEDPWGMAFVSFNLGISAGQRNDDDSALSLLEQSLELFHQLGDVWGMARASQWLGQVFLKQGNYEKAHFFLSQHLRIDEGLHFKQGTMIALLNLGELYRYQGNLDQAEQFYEKSLAMCREYGLKGDWGQALYSLGMIALRHSDYPLARRRFMSYFDSTWSVTGMISACDLLSGLSAVAAGTNQPERAARLYGAAQALFDLTDYRIPPFDFAEFDRHVQLTRGQLGKAMFETLTTEGHAMTMEQAVAYALENVL
ncbi:MAG: tetratricopeptide repeat protein [Chloroflexota bacterium]